MRKITRLALILALCCCFIHRASAQDVSKLVEEGIALHDKGQYEEALIKYEAAHALDPSAFDPLYEKSSTLLALKRYSEAAKLSEAILEQFKDVRGLHLVYVNLGTVYEYMQEPEKALSTYDAGLKRFPDNYLIHFNKAVTLLNLDRAEEATRELEQTLRCNPRHLSSNYFFATGFKSNRVFSVMAAMNYLLTDQESDRAEKALKLIQEQLTKNISVGDSNRINVNISADALDPKRKSTGPNDFSQADIMLTFTGMLSTVKEVSFPPSSQLSSVLKALQTSLSEKKIKNKTGFAWEFYAPFFIDLGQQGFADVAAHIMLIPAHDKENQDWLEENSDKVMKFQDWYARYPWPKLK